MSNPSFTDYVSELKTVVYHNNGDYNNVLFPLNKTSAYNLQSYAGSENGRGATGVDTYLQIDSSNVEKKIIVGGSDILTCIASDNIVLGGISTGASGNQQINLYVPTGSSFLIGSGADRIDIGDESDPASNDVYIHGNNVYLGDTTDSNVYIRGTLTYVDTENLQVRDRTIILNQSGTNNEISGAGFYIWDGQTGNNRVLQIENEADPSSYILQANSGHFAKLSGTALSFFTGSYYDSNSEIARMEQVGNGLKFEVGNNNEVTLTPVPNQVSEVLLSYGQQSIYDSKNFVAGITASGITGADLAISGTASISNTTGNSAFFNNLSALTINLQDISATNAVIANLTGTNVSIANLSSVNNTLTNASIVYLTGTNASLESLTGTNVSIANLNAVNNVLTNASVVSLTGTNVSIANLNSVNNVLTNASVVSLTGTNAVIASLTGSDLAYTNAALTNLNAINTTLTNASVVYLTGTHTAFQNSSILSLTGSNASLTTLSGSDLSYVNSSLTNLTSTQFTGANASISYLTGAHTAFQNSTIVSLTGTNAVIASLTGSDLAYANAVLTNLNNTQLSSANASISYLTGANTSFENSTIVSLTGTNAVISYLTGINASFTNLSASNLDLGETLIVKNITGTNMNITGTASINNLTGARAHFTDITFDNFTGAYATVNVALSSYYTTGNLAHFNNMTVNSFTGNSLYVETSQLTTLTNTYAIISNLTGTNAYINSLTGSSASIASLSTTSLSAANFTGDTGYFVWLTAVNTYKPAGSQFWTITSDSRVKENIMDADEANCLKRIQDIKVKNFNYKQSYLEKFGLTAQKTIGVIADELQQTHPDCVVSKGDLEIEGEVLENFKNVDMSSQLFELIVCCQNLMKRVEELEKRAQ